MKDTLVIYHDNCADGFGAAWAAWYKFGDFAEYMPLQYGKAVEEFDVSVCARKHVYILDFSVPKAKLEAMAAVARHVTILDHHKTAFEEFAGSSPTGDGSEAQVTPLDGKYTVVLHNGKSGALLAWGWFFPNTAAPNFVYHLDDYDRWQFKLPGTKEVNKALWARSPWVFEEWDKLMLPKELDTLRAEGTALLKEHNRQVDTAIRQSGCKCVIGVGTEVFVGKAINAMPWLASDAGHIMATETGGFGLTWYLADSGFVRCSFRSNGDYDVSRICKQFGGGGHKNAAGCEVPLATLLGWLQ